MSVHLPLIAGLGSSTSVSLPLIVGVTPISGGTSGRVLVDSSGVLGESSSVADVTAAGTNTFTGTNTFSGIATFTPAATDVLGLGTFRLAQGAYILAAGDVDTSKGFITADGGGGSDELTLNGTWGNLSLATGIVTSDAGSGGTMNFNTRALTGDWTYKESGTLGLSGPSLDFALDSVVGRTQIGGKGRFHFRHGQAANANPANIGSEPLVDTGMYWNIKYNTDGTFAQENQYWPGHNFQLESAWELVLAGNPNFTYTSATVGATGRTVLNGVTLPIAVTPRGGCLSALGPGHVLRMFAAGAGQLQGGPWRVESVNAGASTVTIFATITGTQAGSTAYIRECAFEINGGLLQSNGGGDAGFRSIGNSISLDNPAKTSNWIFNGQHAIDAARGNIYLQNHAALEVTLHDAEASLRLVRYTTTAGSSRYHPTIQAVKQDDQTLLSQFAWTIDPNGQALNKYALADSVAGRYLLWFDETGKLGIGNNTSPASALDVTGTVTATAFSGSGASLTGVNAATFSTATEAADTTCFPVFVTASGTQTLAGKTNTGLTFNASTGALGATSFVGGAGSFSTLTASDAVTLSPANQLVTISPTGIGYVTINPATTGAMNNMRVGNLTQSTGDFTSIGATAVGTGVFSTLTANGAFTASPANLNVVLSPTGTGLVTINPATAGTMNNVAIGGTTPLAVSATTLSASGTITSTDAVAASAPIFYGTGALYTGGTGTTTFPAIFHQPTGTTAATNWSSGANAGTVFGCNENTAFTGNYIDCKVAGVSKFTVGVYGDVTVKNNLTTTGQSYSATLGTSGVADIAGNFSVATNKFTVAAASGNTAVAGTLAVTGASTLTGGAIMGAPIRKKGYTVATLPAGTQGDSAFVTDALAPTFLGLLTGGGAVVTPVFYNGAAWVAD